MNMSSDETEIPNSARKVRDKITRSIAACERCRKRKQRCDSKLPACTTCASAGVKCVLSNRLVVHAEAQCDCVALREQVSELEAKIKELSHNNGPATDSANLINKQTNQVIDLAARNWPTESATTGLAYSGRILRPTFTTGNPTGLTEMLGSTWSLWYNDESIDTPSALPRDVSTIYVTQIDQDLIDVFFDYCWAHLPILHKSTFTDTHFSPLIHGQTCESLSRFQVYMVLAIAACENRVGRNVQISHRDYFRKATEYLADVLSLPDLDCIQCLLLLCMYGRKEPQAVNMWHTTGLALRTAIGIDLHRQEKTAELSILEREMSKRLFWSAYVMDRSMALAMARPLGIEDSSISVQLPTQHTDEQLVKNDSTEYMPDIVDTSTFIHVVKLRRLNARIYQALHLSEQLSTPDLLNLRDNLYEQLNEWLLTAPRYLTAKSMFQMPEWFQIAYHQAILNLYRPSQAAPLPTPDGLQLCADSSINLVVAYASLYAKNKVSYSFIALTSIFMAAVTMLYSLRASASVRQSSSRGVTETNINTCLTLFRGISDGRDIAEKCVRIISKLGIATLALFDRPDVQDTQVDMEFLTWFGLRSHCLSGSSDNGTFDRSHGSGVIQNFDGPAATLSVDSAWGDIFALGFDYENFGIIGFP